ncbi:alpha/beta fold hydrolase [Rhodococcus maanshanensis]|uniref:alpha/beta fold hydrolase n=1 Tax=Rhodococcus maanshanensis TaxID=183556 RepID=UPI0022B52A60|nr:alpha/beta fold hydrolase [Rhodococcus maanshanensis]MCZ4556218.1 alpha/beta fold hydrolase [Rhodococcus maanshanensis]
MLDFDWRPRLNTLTRNAWGLTFGDGVQAAEPTPSEQITRGLHRDLYRFGPQIGTNPVLLVPPLAAPAQCYDLRPGQSLAAHLLDSGRTPYLVDYGTMTSADRGLGFEAWVDDIIPEALRHVSELHDGAPVDLIGWSLGGTISLLTGAAHADLPIRTITAIGTPVDYTEIAAIAPLRAIGRITGDRPLTTATWALGGLPAPVVQASYRVTALQRELTKPWFIARNLHDTETLARMESIDKFMAAMPGYPARFFHQICTQLILGNTLAAGQFRLGSRTVELSALSVPVLAVGGTDDVIAPVASVARITDLLTGAPSVRFETAPGSHLGLLAGPGAKQTTWAQIDDFLSETAPQLV